MTSTADLSYSRICVTGAAGFLGSHLCDALLSMGATVVALDNFSSGSRENLIPSDRLTIIEGDIRDPEVVAQALRGALVLFHMAALANPRACDQDIELAMDVNVNGTRTLLSCARDVRRIVFMSSVTVYGEPEFLPVNETHPINCSDPYSATKVMGEFLVKAYCHKKRTPYTIVRNSNIYGPRQTADYLIPTLISQGISRGKIEIWDSTPTRDFLFVGDAVQAFVQAASSEGLKNRTVNLGSGEEIRAGELADVVSAQLGVSWRDSHRVTSGARRFVNNPGVFKSLTGWEPGVSLRDGLDKTISYWKNRLTSL